MGVALSQWETFEEAVARLFGVLVQSGPSDAARRAYGRVLGPGRLGLLEEAAYVYFNLNKNSKVDQKEVSRLIKHHGEASGRRNEVAHGVVYERISSRRLKVFTMVRLVIIRKRPEYCKIQTGIVTR
jgi:hypothetical protein